MSRRLLTVLTVLTVLSGTVSTAGHDSAETAAGGIQPPARLRALQGVVDDLRTRLAIQDVVVVSISQNDLAASVARSDDYPDTFSLVLDSDFLAVLDPDELDAAIAHELGHVWIFTHHPYLQTEELANKVALRVVSRGSLERLYNKVWRHGGKGDLQYLPAVHTPPQRPLN